MRCSSVLILLCALAVAGGAVAQPGADPAASATPEQADTSSSSRGDVDASVPAAPPSESPSGAAAPPPGATGAPGADAPAGPMDPSEPSAADPAEVQPPSGPATDEGAVIEPPSEDPIGTDVEGDAAIEIAPAPSPESTAAAAEIVPSPAEMSERLNEGLDEFDGGDDDWTAPVPVLSLDGYMRVRGELMDTFWLGRPSHVDAAREANELDVGALGPDPFSRFRALERREAVSCVDEGTVDGVCDVDTLQFANLRLRLSPQINLTEDVRVHATFDILDNVVAGERPLSFYGTSTGNNNYSPAFADSVQPGGGWLGDSIIARRAWAEVRNRDLGELRFGRMPDHWGLGMRYNAGNGLDQDYSSDVDRVMAITKLAGFYFTAAYDFLAEGAVAQDILGDIPYRPYYDGSQLDDLDQFTFSVSRQLSREEEDELLARGDMVLNGGLRFELRNQDALYRSANSVAGTADNAGTAGETAGADLQALNMTRYVPDLWGQLKLPGIRIEAEVAWAFGTMSDPEGEVSGDRTINQLGAALETEFRFLEDKLALYFNAGFATGDEDVEGLSADADFVNQPGDDRITTYAFHPSYQVDMILWRNIMRQVTGAYYFKPGLSYDFVRTDFGELFGARLDLIWSRASSLLQAPGNKADLGVELNAQLYWRSEDGAELDDGYHASLQYGVLFPLSGLGFPNYDQLAAPKMEPAQQLRLVLGVVF